MRLRATQLSSNAHGPLRTVAALVAAMFAATTAPAFDWTAGDLSTQYQDSGGTLPVTNVEQPAGLVLDRSKGGAQRGPELVFDPGFNVASAWTLSEAVISNGQLVVTGATPGTARATPNTTGRLVVGKIYEVMFDIISISGTGGFSVGTAGSGIGLARNAVGRYREVIVASSTQFAVYLRGSAANGVLDNISIREVIGPNLWTGTPSVKDANWTDNGDGSFTSNGGTGLLGWPVSTKGIVAGRTYECIVRVTARTAGQLTLPYDGAGSNNTNAVASVGTFRRIFTAVTTALYIYGLNFAGTVDSIYIAEIPGNHLIQPTSASRPTLTARVNLLTYSEQISHANWSKSAGGTGTVPTVTDNFGVAPDGTTTAARVQLAINGGTTTADISRITQPITGMPIGGMYTQGLWLKTNDGSTKVVQFRDDNAGTVGKNITVTGAWQYFSQDNTVSAGSTTINAIGLWVRGTLGTADSADLLMWHPQFNIGSPIRYQRIGAATDYDTVGFAKGWRFDGVDDGLYSPANVDFSVTSKLTVVAALRKATNAGRSQLLELGASGVTAGSFGITAPEDATGALSAAQNAGSASRARNTSAYPAPQDLTFAVSYDLAAGPTINDQIPLVRVNGSDAGISNTGATVGTGVFANALLNMGRRNNTSFPFTGVVNSMRGVGRRTSPDEIGWLLAQAKLDMSNNL